MKSIYQHQRFTAAQEFQKSLHQLGEILQVGHHPLNEKTSTRHTYEPTNHQNTGSFNLAALEDAVADIEQYLARKNQTT